MREEHGEEQTGGPDGRTDLESIDCFGAADHGNVLFKYILQHYGHGVDWNAWFTCSGRCRCGRYVRAAVCTLFTDELIALFHVGDAETVRYAVVYTRITCGLVIFSYLTVVLTGIYTAQGDSKTPLVANFLGLFVNVVLDRIPHNRSTWRRSVCCQGKINKG